MLSLADVGEESLADFKALVDIGDLLAVRGEVITSRRGELSVAATEWEIAAKTLRPLPNEHRPLSDEARIRLRYVDMMIRPEAREMVRTKATVLKSLRQHPRRARLRRGRDPDPPADQRRCRGPAVPDPPERPRPGHAAPDRARARPQAGDDRRRRQGLRDRPHLPQRGPRLHPRRRVLDARGLRGLRRPVHDDGAGQGARGRRGEGGRPHRRTRAQRRRDRPRGRMAAGLDPRPRLRGARRGSHRRNVRRKRCESTPRRTTSSCNRNGEQPK